MKMIALNLVGPFKWIGEGDHTLFAQEIIKKRGLYIWAIPFADGYLVYYVGMTYASFEKRFNQHIESYLTGKYRIYDPAKFKEGKKNLFWPGGYKTVQGSKTTTEFLDYYLNDPTNYGKTLKDFLELFYIFLSPLDEDMRTIERIEAEVNKHINEQQGLIGKFQDQDIRYKPTRPGEGRLSVKINCKSKILGIPETIEI